jgi:hypothetical protein
MKSRNCWDRVIHIYGRRYVFRIPHRDVNFNSILTHGPCRCQAALCALRVIKRVPELADHFTTKCKNLLTDRNHGVLLTAITLVTEMCQIDESCLAEFRNVRSHFTI